MKHLRILDLLLKLCQGDGKKLYIWIARVEVKGDILASIATIVNHYKFSGLNNRNVLSYSSVGR